MHGNNTDLMLKIQQTLTVLPTIRGQELELELHRTSLS